MQKLNIEIENENFVTVKLNRGGISSEKLITYPQLQTLLGGTSPSYDSGWLPGETGVQRIKTKSDGRTYMCYLEPPQVRTVKYRSDLWNEAEDRFEEDDYEDYDDYRQDVEDEYYRLVDLHGEDEDNEFQVPMPILGVLARYRPATDGGVYFEELVAFSLKNPILTGNETVYYPPVNNIYEDGRICWGNADIRLTSPRQLEGLWTTFFHNYANYDLALERIHEYTAPGANIESFKPHHLHRDIHELIKDGMSHEEALDFVSDKLEEHHQITNLNNFFDR